MPNKQQRLLLGPLPLFLARHSQSVAHRSSISFVLLDGTSLQQKQFLIRPYHMLFKPSGFCNIQSQNTSRPARRATARGTVTWGLYGFQFFFSRIMHQPLWRVFPCRDLEIAIIEMLVRFFLHGITNYRTISTRSLGQSGRPPEAFGGLTLPTGVI